MLMLVWVLNYIALPAGFLIILYLIFNKIFRRSAEKPENETGYEFNQQSGQRIKYGSESGTVRETPCGACCVSPGQYHKPGCEYEQCPVCGGRVVACNCLETDKILRQSRKIYQKIKRSNIWDEEIGIDDINEAQWTTTLKFNGRECLRIKYGEGADNWWGAGRFPCDECNVVKGQYHVSGCDNEVCPVCGGKLSFCDCIPDDEPEPEPVEEPDPLAKSRANNSNIGREPLRGEMILAQESAFKPFAVWAHTDCYLILTNKRLIFWDLEEDAYSFAIFMDGMENVRFEKGSTDQLLLIDTGYGKQFEIGIKDQQWERILEQIRQITNSPGSGMLPHAELSGFGFELIPGENIFLKETVCKRFKIWSHTDCTLIITNHRLIFRDREDDKYSFIISEDELAEAIVNETMIEDLVIILANGTEYEIGVKDREQLERIKERIEQVIQG
jgi:hypothetical protein